MPVWLDDFLWAYGSFVYGLGVNAILGLSMYAVLAKGSRPDVTPPPKPGKLIDGKPGVVIIQAILPEKDIELKQSAYKIQAGQQKAVPVFLYNFGKSKIHGRLSVVAPKDWKVELPAKVELAPGDRKELALALTAPATGTNSNINIRINGDFGSDERPALSLHFISTTE